MNEATFRVIDDEIRIFTHYQHRERCKLLDGARWNPSGKYWSVDASPYMAQAIREAFKGVGNCGVDSGFKALMNGHVGDAPDVDLSPNLDALITPLWNHQEEAVKLALPKQGFMLAHDMGAGKTLSAIKIILERGHQRVLVFAPKRVLSTWKDQLREHAGSAILAIVPPEKRAVAKRAEFIRDMTHDFDPPYAVILNYDTVATKTKMRDLLRSLDWDLLILDESHRIKAAGGSTSKWIANLAGRIPYKLSLTGTPLPHSPLDIYAQYRAIDPSIFGTSYVAFKARYAIMHPEYKNMPVQFLNQDELHEKMYQIAHRVETADVIDLPERLEIPVYVELGKEAFQHYVDLETEFYTWVEESNEEVTPANALVKLLRLQQLTGGNLVTDDGNTVRVDSSKQEALSDLLTDLPQTEPVVVFAQFHADLDAIKEAAEKAGRRYGEISGRVNEDDYEAWKRGEIDLIGTQIQAGGEGLNELVRARYCIYWSTGFSLGRFNQSRARLLRPGQHRNVVEYHLTAKGTVDERVAEALRKKQEIVSYILDAR